MNRFKGQTFSRSGSASVLTIIDLIYITDALLEK